MSEHKIIGFFRYCVEEASSNFSGYFYHPEFGVNTIIENVLADNYGDGLDLILISYFFDGFKSLADKQKRFSRFTDKSIAVHINVGLDDFYYKENSARKEFIVESILSAVDDVSNKLSKKDTVNIDFAKLKEDLNKVAKIYLTNTEDLTS